MDYTRLGTTGLQVSRICLGMLSFGSSEWRPWVLDEEASRPIVRRAVELGITFFDTADVYSLGASEEISGKLLKEFTRRDEVVIATKVNDPMGDMPNRSGLSRKHIFDSCFDSLRRLDVDYIDLYQIHRFDYRTPIEETLGALHDLVKAGWVRYLGASSMHAYQFAKMLYKADLAGQTRFVAMQNHLNLLYREEERDMLPLCREEGVGVIPWSPLARGFLTRRPGARQATLRGENDAFAEQLYSFEGSDAIVEAVCDLAEARGVSPAQVALAWLLSRPGVTAPIVGSTRVEHLEDAVAALTLELSDDEVAGLERDYRPREVQGHS
jgi:aryl-alcohol dehydrogenase (NADP+)